MWLTVNFWEKHDVNHQTGEFYLYVSVCVMPGSIETESNTVWKTIAFLISTVALLSHSLSHKAKKIIWQISKITTLYQPLVSCEGFLFECVWFCLWGHAATMCLWPCAGQCVCVYAATCLTLLLLVCKCPVLQMTGRHMGVWIRIHL